MTGKAEEFQELRPLLFAIAYRLLGSVVEAEDAVQETWLRYARTETRPVSVKAFLSAAVTRVSLNVLASARVRREAYVGQWLPEPLLDDPYQDPERSAELADSVSMAALLLLERLTPLERAVFVLREVFGFGFQEIAEVVDRSEAACRQLAVRARRHMDDGRPRFSADRKEREELSARFFDALRDGDVAGLRGLLAADVRMTWDTDGTLPQVPGGVFGAEKVTRMLTATAPGWIAAGAKVERREVNGQSGALVLDAQGGVLAVMVLDVLDGRIDRIRTVVTPAKLTHLRPNRAAPNLAADATPSRAADATPGCAADAAPSEQHSGRRAGGQGVDEVPG
ncbi:RNA polymerase sigma-70 factor [Yinghuangia sp. YIM S09857]|uniref:RNA polymerase sigma-70 factor n=1 Tax=Yinghuangia sp. YIM S09857 TaxID=3436929 RepID=UPI003F5340C4